MLDLNPAGTAALAAPLVTLSDEQADVVRYVATAVTADPNLEPDWFCRQAHAAVFGLPANLRAQVLRFGDVGSDTGILVIRGLRVDDPLTSTPLDNTRGIAAATHFVKQMGVIAHLLGTMVGYEAENAGRLVQDMVPNPAFAMTQQSQSSGVELEAHTEQCFSPLRPDYVMLGALRGDPTAFTFIYPGRAFTTAFTDDEIDLLRKPLWMTQIDESFQPYVPDPFAVRGPFPILSGPLDDPQVLVDQDLMRGVTDVAQQLLEKVITSYVARRAHHALLTGDLLLLDNYRAMHGRSTFAPRFDGTDRFIARGFIVRDRQRLAPYLHDDRRTVAAAYS